MIFLTLIIFVTQVLQEPDLTVPLESVRNVSLVEWSETCKRTPFDHFASSHFVADKATISIDGRWMVGVHGRQDLKSETVLPCTYWISNDEGKWQNFVGFYNAYERYDRSSLEWENFWKSISDDEWKRMGFKRPRIGGTMAVPTGRVWTLDGQRVMFWVTRQYEYFGLDAWDFNRRLPTQLAYVTQGGGTYLLGKPMAATEDQQFSGFPDTEMNRWATYGPNATQFSVVRYGKPTKSNLIVDGDLWGARLTSSLRALDFRKRKAFSSHIDADNIHIGIDETDLLDPDEKRRLIPLRLGAQYAYPSFVGLLPSGRLLVEEIVPGGTNLYLSDVARTKFEIVGHERIIATSIDNRWLIVGAPKWDGPHWLVKLKD